VRVTILICLICILCFAKVLFSQEELPPIKTTRITENIVSFYVNDYVGIVALGGPDGILLVDAGFQETTKQVRDQLKALWGDDIVTIINTHADGDHTGGNEDLGRNAVIMAHSRCRKLLEASEEYPNAGLPTITFEDDLTLHLNSEDIHMMAMIGSHSGEDIIVHFKKANIVCLGDAVLSDSFPFVRLQRGASIEGLLDNLDRLISSYSQDTKFIVSHGRDLTMDDLRTYREMIAETTKLVTEAVKRGKTAEQMKKEGILKDWEDWNNKRHTWINADFWIDTICQSLNEENQ